MDCLPAGAEQLSAPLPLPQFRWCTDEEAWPNVLISPEALMEGRFST
jgi:hypothetical protein